MAISLKKHLEQLTKEELVEEILKLNKKFKEVKTYYEMDLGGEEQQTKIVNEVKNKLKKEFARREHPKASVLRKIITDFKKVAVFPHDVIDILLCRIELEIDFLNQYRYMSTAFYEATRKSYEEAIKLIEKEGAETHFNERCLQIQHRLSNIGWGFGYVIQRLK